METALIHGHPMTCLVGFSIALRQLTGAQLAPADLLDSHIEVLG